MVQFKSSVGLRSSNSAGDGHADHRVVAGADQILVVDHGKIVQQGTHEQLIKQPGIYANFVSERNEAASWKISDKNTMATNLSLK